MCVVAQTEGFVRTPSLFPMGKQGLRKGGGGLNFQANLPFGDSRKAYWRLRWAVRSGARLFRTGIELQTLPSLRFPSLKQTSSCFVLTDVHAQSSQKKFVCCAQTYDSPRNRGKTNQQYKQTRNTLLELTPSFVDLADLTLCLSGKCLVFNLVNFDRSGIFSFFSLTAF